MYNERGERVLWTIGILKASPQELTNRHSISFKDTKLPNDMDDAQICDLSEDLVLFRYLNSPVKGTGVKVAVEMTRREGLLALEKALGFEEFYWLNPLDSEA